MTRSLVRSLIGAFVLIWLLTGVIPSVLAQTLDDRVRKVASQLMCPVCEGRPVAESTSELAGQMRAIIREKLQRGESPEQIVAYFVDRYGESALAAPPRGGLGLAVWLAPAVAILAGALFVIVRFRSGSPVDALATPLSPSDDDDV